MKALDVMVRNVVTVKPDDQVTEAIKLLAEHDVSALPVVDDGNNVVGIISEADLLHRQEIGTEKYRPWWLEAVTPASTLAGEFAKSHGRRVAEVMSTDIVSAAGSPQEHKALLALAEGVPGVATVADEMIPAY